MTASALRGHGTVAAVVLAGGASRRMGRDKALLEVDGQRLVDLVAGGLAPVVDEVVVASGSRPLDRADEVADAPDTSGPLAGLVAGLRATSASVVVVVPVDAPRTGPDLLLRLARVCLEQDRPAAVAVADGHVQALHAAFHREAVRAIETRVAAGEWSPRRLLGWLDAVRVDHDGWSDLDPTGGFARDWDRPADLPAAVQGPSGP